MPALGTMFVAVLLWYIVPGVNFISDSWLDEIFPKNSLLYPILLLLLTPALVTLASLRIRSRKPHSELSKQLSRAHQIGMIATLVTWLGILTFGNWFEVTHSRIPSDWLGMTTLVALLPLVLSIGLTSMPITWYSGRRSVALLNRDFWQQCRPNLVLLLPLTLLSGLEEWLLLHPDRIIDLSGPLWLISIGLYLVIIILGGPLLLQYMLSSRPIPAGALRDKLMNLARRGGIRCGIPRIWNTGSRPILNAMITGLVPFQRKIFITDHLLEVSSNDELDAIFAHELAHARHGHLWLYLLTGIGFIFSLLLFDSEVPSTTTMMTMGSITLLFWIFFGKLSRQLEHQADIVSDELTGQPGAIAQALARIAMLGSGLNQRGGWRHPPILERIRVLHHYREDPQFRARFRRHSRRLLLFIGFLVAIPGSVLLVEAADELSNSPWQQQFDHGLAFIDAVEEIQSRPGHDQNRQRELLLGAEKWFKQGVDELRQLEPGHPALVGAYVTLALIYDRLDQPWNAAACRILANNVRAAEPTPR
ncbi:MAG: M48 family metalloprotease [Planctomycetota bacterium]|nr:M48 family metalloprotease [Planctomycetota bacterium]